MRRETIYNIALNLRKEIEQCQEHGYFMSFPNGFCALSSIWIYDILSDKQSHIIEIRQKNSFFKNNPHTWVHCDGFDVDITPDQFKGSNFPKVYVGSDNIMYHHFDEITSKEILFPTEFILKQMCDNLLKEGIETLYKNLDIDANLFYKTKPEY